MRSNKLTPRQKEVWVAMIRLQSAANGIPATMQEIADEAGMKSRSDIPRYLGALQQKGYATNYGGSSHRAWVAHELRGRAPLGKEDRLRSPRELVIEALKDMPDMRADLSVGQLLMHAGDGRLFQLSDEELSDRLRSMATRWRKASAEAKARCAHA